MIYAIMAQCLAEISLLFLNAEGVSGNIAEAADSREGIEEEPDELIPCCLEPELQ